MITLKDNAAIEKMRTAGQLLCQMYQAIEPLIKVGISTAELDAAIAKELAARNLRSQALGYKGYRHASCISINDEVVHGVPQSTQILKEGDLVKIDVCAAWSGYCADMSRCFFIGSPSIDAQKLVDAAQKALDKGIEMAKIGNRLSDISYAIQQEIEKYGYGIVRDFAGHGIGRSMHEDPEILNYGKPGKGPLLQAGMTFALEPMITQGKEAVYIAKDGWTVKTVDKSLAAHVEDTIVITEMGPEILTRCSKERGF